MFGRFVDRLAGRVTYIVPDLVGAVLAAETTATKVEADAWIYAGSLPRILGGEIGPPARPKDRRSWQCLLPLPARGPMDSQCHWSQASL